MLTAMQVITLQSGNLTLALRPDVGASVEGFWCGEIPILRSCGAGSLKHARLSGSYPLVPFSNRVAKARLQWNGTSHPLVKNFSGEEHSIHGIGFERAWELLESTENFAMMSLEHRADSAWPFAFDASQTFKLSPDRLDISLNITNQSPSAAPVGLGWHPYFVKRSRSRLAFSAEGRWEMGVDKLPTQRSIVSGLDVDAAYLESDHCFDGWSGVVHLRDECLHMTMRSSLSRLVVFTNDKKDFVAVEPVSHVNNAMNQTDAQNLGVVVLQSGQSWSATMSIEVTPV